MTKVLVTGASGFIAKHIVRELLEQGHEVRASIRSDRRRAELEALFPDADLDFVTLDLNLDDGWSAALEGVDVLMHTASPFPATVPKDREDLIRPAVDGTMRAMRSAQQAGVTRVILTSSCAAIYKDANKPPMQQADESNWTDPDHPSTSAYEASKTLAERAAWQFVEEHPEMRLTTINPGGVFGPAMDRNYGTSLQIVERLLAGKDPMLPKINMPVVDVRDVARMHVAALTNDETVGERFAANAGAMTMVEIAETLNEAELGASVTTREAPSWLLKIFALFDKTLAQVVGNLGRNGDVNGSKAERVMGFSYIPSREALVSSARYIRSGA